MRFVVILPVSWDSPLLPEQRVPVAQTCYHGLYRTLILREPELKLNFIPGGEIKPYRQG